MEITLRRRNNPPPANVVVDATALRLVSEGHAYSTQRCSLLIVITLLNATHEGAYFVCCHTARVEVRSVDNSTVREQQVQNLCKVCGYT